MNPLDHPGRAVARPLEKDGPAGVGDALDPIGPYGDPTVRDGRIGARQLQQTDLGGSERDAGRPGEPAGDAKALGRGNDFGYSGLRGDLGGDRIDRAGKSLTEGQFARIRAVYIARFPAPDLDRTVDDHRGWPQSVFQSRQVDNGLEGGARLTPGLDRPVELAPAVTAAADHRPDGAVHGQHHDRGLGNAPGPAPAADQIGDRPLGRALQSRIQRGLDHEAAGIRTHITGQLIHHPIRVVQRGVFAAWRPNGTRAAGLRALVLGGGDQSLFAHGGENDRRALPRRLVVADRIEPRRRLERADQHGCLVEAQMRRRFIEETPRRGLQTVGAGAEVHPVQVNGQNLFLGETLLQPQRQQRFLYLALDRSLGRQKQVFRRLLGEGAAALTDAPGPEIDRHGAADPAPVDAAVLIKPAILDGDQGLGKIGRHLGELDGPAPELADRRKAGAVGRDQRDAGFLIL